MRGWLKSPNRLSGTIKFPDYENEVVLIRTAPICGWPFVAAEVIHDDDITRGERRHEDLLDVSQKTEAVDRPIEHAGRVDPVVAQRGQEGERSPPRAE
jgi:hypothetical protein